MVAYEEVALDDMVWNDEVQAYTYECPCGDLFQISLAELRAGESIARCPSCSLYLQVTYDPEDFAEEDEGEVVTLTTAAAPQPVPVA